ncbi:MAG: alpha/beta hydrolase [Nocardioides sp.]
MSSGPLARPERIEVDLPALRASALPWGPPDGPLVLALHGFPDTAWTWRHLGPHLAGLGFRVVAPYLRGYAPSGLPADGSYHVGALMADAVAWHEVLGGDDRAALVGHDWGALIAHGLAAHDSSPFAITVALAVPPIPAMAGSGPLTLLRQGRLSWYVLFNQLPVLPERYIERLARRLWRDWSPGHDAAEDLPHVLAAIGSRDRAAAAVGYYRAARSSRSVPKSYRSWQKTWSAMPTRPLLYLHGADDGCLQAAYAERARSLLPTGSRTVVVPGCGHFLQVERPNVVNDEIARWLGS